jgi:hypothetical protein
MEPVLPPEMMASGGNKFFNATWNAAILLEKSEYAADRALKDFMWESWPA